MMVAMVRGYMTEVELFEAVQADMKSGVLKDTTAQQVLDMLGINLGDAFDFQVPQRVIDESIAAIAESFDQPYWAHVNETTRRDMQAVLNQAVREGWSTQRLAREFNNQFGAEYDLKRSTLVARTEIPDALNRGHVQGIREINQGMPELEMGKEWISVFATTSRHAHMGLDGTIVPVDENFTLNGVECGHPGHWVLPAKDRCNCLCTILSAFLTEALGISGQDPNNTDSSAQTPKDLFDKIEQNERLAEQQRQVAKQKYSTAAAGALITAAAAYLGSLRQAARTARQQGTDSEAYQEDRRTADRLRQERIVAQNRADAEAIRNGTLTLAVIAAGVNSPETQTEFGDGSAITGVLPVATDAFRERVEVAESFVAAFLDARVIGLSLLATRWFQLQGTQRPHHRGNVEEWEDLNLNTLTGMFADGNASIATLIHLLVHSLEARSKRIQELSREFVERRIEDAGTEDVRLIDIFPNRGFNANEFGNEDDFGRAFPGNTPDRFFAGKRNKSTGHTEVLAMGVELLFTDPKGFASRDPSYFKFVVGVMNGTLL